ncbi:MAG: protein phosphatase 2C domain-containing protein [Anaerolineae bacterium]|nr:protein phosphatase 2C domain-containing protein [Anaerolineae bacterium]
MACGAMLASEAPAEVADAFAISIPADLQPPGESPPADVADTRTEVVQTSAPPSYKTSDEPADPIDSLVVEEPDDATDAPVVQHDLATNGEDADPATPVPPTPNPDEAVVNPVPGADSDPLPSGTVIDERYTIIALLHEGSEGRIYSASDPGTCGQCGGLVEPGDSFCGACGLEVTGPAVIRLHEIVEVPNEALPAVEVDGRWFVVLPVEEETQEAEDATPNWRLQVGQASDAGKIRELDEDSVFTLTLSGIYESRTETAVGLFIVADGIGGHEGGEVASKLAAQTIAQQVLQRIIWPILQGETLLPETLGNELGQAVEAANRRVYDLRVQRGTDMGTTLTLALVVDSLAVIANAGDSRTYVWGPDGLMQLTRDHSLIADLVASGEEPPDAFYTHPERNLIYRSLGDRPQVELDLFTLELEPGYRLILCCDGVWEMIRNEGIEDVMLQEDHPQRAADMIVKWANDAGGEDNISVVVVNVEQQ